MKIYKIEDINEYSKLVIELFSTGATNMIEEEVPLFSEPQEMFDFFNIEDELINKIYDDDGRPTWDYKNNLLPLEWLNAILESRLRKIRFSYPFYVVVDGHSGWDKMGNMESKTFYEVQKIEVL